MIPFNHRIRQRLFRIRAEDRLPHLVSHQRVYIVPTGRGWAFLLALLLMLVASVNYALSLGYALCFLLTGLFAATLLHTYRNLAGLQIMKIDGGKCFANESLPFSIMLTNHRAQARHGLRLATADARVSNIRLEPAQDCLVMLPVPATQRGIRPLGRLTLQSDWPLGLWTCWSYLHVATQGLVYPSPETNPPALPLAPGDEGDTSPKAGLQGDVSGLRSYRPGDSIGSIAWKSAARGQGLLVRTFDNDEGSSKTALNLQSTGLPAIEQQLSRLCAWVLLAESRQTPYTLQLSTQHLSAAHGAEQRARALQALATYDSAAVQAT